jgi:phenylpropionate dioxygenase-like ring-hydroxylating dioxygenase large terminal subunit
MQDNAATPGPGPVNIGSGPFMPDREILEHGFVPVEVYTSQERFDFEIEEVFKKVWLNVGRVEQIPDAGDFFVKELAFAKVSALIVRGRDGEIRAFHNVCRHRGMQVVWDQAGSRSQFRCIYHAWVYNTEGELTYVPERECFPELDQKKSSLQPIATATLGGFIFVNLAPRPAQSLEDFLGGYGDHLRTMPLGKYNFVLKMSKVLGTNWKLGVEANQEGYHVHSMHIRTVRDIIRTKDNPFTHFGHQEYYGPHRYGSILANPEWRPTAARPVHQFAVGQTGSQLYQADGKVGALPGHSGTNLGNCPNWATDSVAIFPNIIFQPSTNSWFTQHFWPIAPNKSLWEAHYYYPEPTTLREKFASEHGLMFNRDTVSEDYIALEKQQRMLESGAIQFIQFSRAEDHPRHQAAILAALEQRTRRFQQAAE